MGVISLCRGRIEDGDFSYKRPMACDLHYVVQALQLASKKSVAETRAAAGAAARIVLNGRNVDGPR